MLLSLVYVSRALSCRILRALLPTTGPSDASAQGSLTAMAAFRTAGDKLDALALKRVLSNAGVAVTSQVYRYPAVMSWHLVDSAHAMVRLCAGSIISI